MRGHRYKIGFYRSGSRCPVVEFAVFVHAVDKKDFKQKDIDKAVLMMKRIINTSEKMEI
jgi:hypothetical protein